MIKHSNSKSGSALFVTLGLLAVATLLVFAFAYSSRIERIAARQARDSLAAEERIDSVIAAVMADEVPRHLYNSYNQAGNGFVISSNGKIDFRKSLVAENTAHFSKHAFTSQANVSYYCGTCRFFLNNISTNYLPGALIKDVVTVDADWLPNIIVDEKPPHNIMYTNALYAYAVVDVSGLLDANTVTSNQLAFLQKLETDIADVDTFLKDRARHATSPSDDIALEGYASYRDMVIRNGGLTDNPNFLFHMSYDPSPDYTVTNDCIYGNYYLMYSNGNAMQIKRSPSGTVAKYDINSWTNGFTGDLTNPDDLANHYASRTFREGWLRETTNRLAFCGFAAAEPIAWNLVNFLDGDRIPQSSSPTAWREDWPQEDVPLINEIAVAQVPMDFGYTNCYATAIELWYPFVTNTITEADNVQLVTAVYTNWPGDSYFAQMGNSWTNDVILLGDDNEYGFTVSNNIERMEFGTATEYTICTAPPEKYISFPVEIINFMSSGSEREIPVSYVEESIWRKADHGTNTLYSHTENLPIGIQTYTTYVESNGVDDVYYVRKDVTVTNSVRLLTRVRLGDRWVDEAMAYDPDPSSGFNEEPYEYLTPCGWQVNDPRRNGHQGDWSRYEGIEYEVEAGVTNFACTLTGTTNAICKPWHTYGQGLPIVHFDAPARIAGDIGYVYEPYSSFDGGLSVTSNLWQSICLADSRILATHGSFSFSAGSALEFFTARCATNRAVRGLVSVNTTYDEVIGALLADIEIGQMHQRTRLPDSLISWMTDVYRQTRVVMYDQESTPIGVGDFCMAVGAVPSYRNIHEDYFSDEDDIWHWNGSIGNEIKEDIIRELSERLSFRQQIFVIVIDVRSTTPALTVRAERRVLAVVVRDAYTGAWKVVEKHAL